MDELSPKDHREAVAIFRSEIIGALVHREFDRGDLKSALEEISRQRFRPPASSRTRTFSIPTLQRWYYAYRAGGLEALRAQRRKDRGRAQQLTAEQRELLLDIRREHPTASVPLILRTLVADGRLSKDEISAPTVRRLYRDNGLDRLPAREGKKMRLRWQAERPGALWHGDVCYGPSIRKDGKILPVRIHGLLDDASRFVVALEAHHTEREVDMLGVFVRALRRHGPPDALYLDNGPTYRGHHLRTACARLGISLLHARPYDAPARGKIERFWKTLRSGCLDFLGTRSSLHDVNVRLWAFLDQHYHSAPHASLLGHSPDAVYHGAERSIDALDEEQLRKALTVRLRRRVRRDNTLSVDGTDYELDQGFLSGRLVTVAHGLVDPTEPPWIEHEGKQLPLHPLDPVRNARRNRRHRWTPGEKTVAFDPPTALLDRASGRNWEDKT